MFKQGMNRREFFLKLSQYFLTFSVLGRGIEQGLASARPTFTPRPNNSIAFTKDEFKIIKSITSIIIPTDENPGANETRIAEYVLEAFQERGTETVTAIKGALATINAQSQQFFAATYNNLTQQQQEKLVEIIAKTPDYASFWQPLRTLTVLRFYSLPEGYKPAGLPGPNVDRGGFPFLGC
ncbi:gluconate 2-dehydrogenase subunit 3 family protein [Nostoc sp.]|uniref:gluconate 2-dehydrogenase subunit 3 family protein n=1 Tax=Nostoc sp. TaxID=1180 RepID=UPI002FF4524A